MSKCLWFCMQTLKICKPWTQCLCIRDDWCAANLLMALDQSKRGLLKSFTELHPKITQGKQKAPSYIRYSRIYTAGYTQPWIYSQPFMSKRSLTHILTFCSFRETETSGFQHFLNKIILLFVGRTFSPGKGIYTYVKRAAISSQNTSFAR